jgi:thiol-disulfide isomerase/thioredoxin
VSNALVLGPLVVPYSLLLVVAVAALTFSMVRRMGKKDGVEAEPVLWRALVFGLVLARLGFVYEFRDAYLASPFSIVDLRDGGWNALVGFVGAWFYVLNHVVRHPVMRRPLHRALWTASATWLVGSTALVAMSGTGTPLPSLVLPALDGQTLNLASFRGKPTVVNLWATWCPPCAREMPVMASAQALNPAVNFVFVNQGESARQVAAWLSQRQLNLRNVVVDSTRQVGAALNQAAYPTTLFFDAEGHLLTTRIGELSRATLTQKLNQLNK